MFLQIGDTFINQDRIEYVRIYVESDTREKLLGTGRIKYDIRDALLPSTIVTYYKAVIVVKSKDTQQRWIISAYSDEYSKSVEEKVGCLKQKLFENLGIHNIKIDLDTGEVVR